MKEKKIEDGFLLYMRGEFDAWGQKIHSGAVMKSYKDRFGRVRQNKINLADEGTPDTVFCVPVVITSEMVGKRIGAFVAIEIKKDEDEVQAWLRKVDRYDEAGSCPKSNRREIAQSLQMDRINRAGGIAFVSADLSDLDMIRSSLLTTFFEECNTKDLTRMIKKANNDDIIKNEK